MRSLEGGCLYAFARGPTIYKRNLIITFAIIGVLISVLFVSIPKVSCDDAGTQERVALMCKIADWNILIKEEFCANS